MKYVIQVGDEYMFLKPEALWVPGGLFTVDIDAAQIFADMKKALRHLSVVCIYATAHGEEDVDASFYFPLNVLPENRWEEYR